MPATLLLPQRKHTSRRVRLRVLLPHNDLLQGQAYRSECDTQCTLTGPHSQLLPAVDRRRCCCCRRRRAVVRARLLFVVDLATAAEPHRSVGRSERK
jgi:hypothetical protein